MAMALVFSCSISFAQEARAEAWGTNIAAAILKQSLEKIARQIEGAILGALKASAIQLLNTQVGQLIGGSSAGGSAIISDWREFLYSEPEQKVQVYMEDFFAQMTSGRASSSNYDSPYSLANGTNPTIGNYSVSLVEAGRASLNSSPQPCKELDRFPDPASAIGDGNIAAINAALVNPMCNPIGFSLGTQSVAMQKAEEERNINFVKSIASGYKPIESNGKTILPGSTIGQMVADANDIGNKVIAAASNPAELASGIIVSLVNKTITNTIQKGIGNVQANIQREISNVNRQITGQFNEINQALGPAAGFVREVRQQTNVIVKPATNSKAAIPQSYDP